MNREDFADAALVILGHGTTQNAESARPVYQHAAELRRRKIFAEVREAFWKQEPQVKQVLVELKTPRVFIAPLFISEGYFSEEIIPRELGFSPSKDPRARITHHASRITHYCKPIGTHSRMTEVLLARAREVVEQFPFPRTPKPRDTTLFIAGHGTERNENSRAAIERQVAAIRAMDVFAGVRAAFLEEEPRIAGCLETVATRNVVIIPLFISDGLHVGEDIPVLLGESKRVVKERLAAGQPTWRNPTEKHGRLTWCSHAVGTHPGIAEVILARVRESARTGDDENQTKPD